MSGISRATALRQLLSAGTHLAPACIDGLTTRIVEALGFEIAYLGGYVLGASTCISEPLLTLSEVAYETRKLARATRLPVVVDAGAGWGEPLHVRRTLSELIDSGASGIQLEDQAYPKRAHYHKGVEETVSTSEMLAKIAAARQGAGDSGAVLIARTDAIRTEGIEKALERIALYAKAGADLVMVFPEDLDQAMTLPQRIGIPLAYVNSVGNRFSRPVLDFAQAEKAGYRLVVDAITPVLVEYEGMHRAYSHLRKEGRPLAELASTTSTRDSIETLLGLDEMYELETASVGTH
jgi:methylisocitrate lyase